MTLRIRFRFDGRCSVHPRYNPETDGRPQQQDCPGCDTLWVASLYCGIARRKAEAGKGILVSHPEIHGEKNDSAPDGKDPSGTSKEEGQAEPGVSSSLT
jgi:hypothetical protein